MPAQPEPTKNEPATSFSEMAVNAFSAYPLAAIFLAFGLGYLVMRLLR